MKTDWTPPSVDLQLVGLGSGHRGNRLLFEWLCSDVRRPELFAALAGVPHRHFESRAPHPDTGARPRQLGNPTPRKAVLVLDPGEVTRVLADKGGAFSAIPYAEIGSGSFMLGLDPLNHPAHQVQTNLLSTALQAHLPAADILCDVAVQEAAVLELRSADFDAAQLARQAAVRLCALLFGFGLKDVPVIDAAGTAAHEALAYVNLARHFVTDPVVIKRAERALAELALRAGALLDEYALLDWGEWPEDVETPPLSNHPSVMRLLARNAGAQSISGEQLAVLVAGAIAGTVGNVQAAACIALHSMLNGHTTGQGCPVHQALISDAPVPFVSRRAVKDDGALGINDGDDVVLALGAAVARCSSSSATAQHDMLFGATPSATHPCTGREFGGRLVTKLVKHVLGLPHVAHQIDSVDGKPRRPERRWAFIYRSLPLTHRRDLCRLQQPLNVAMRVKSPVAEHAAQLRAVIRTAAPRIERALQASRHVHFAWFEFHDNDHTLVLHTVYDGDFNAYIEHFALEVGELFDLLFEHVEAAPPKPVKEHPFEFVQLIARFNRPPAGGYFFSAYPQTSCAQVTRLARSTSEMR